MTEGGTPYVERGESGDREKIEYNLMIKYICKISRGLARLLSEKFWRKILKKHFPSYFLLHQLEYKVLMHKLYITSFSLFICCDDTYFKLQAKGVSWKKEYIKAYVSLSLRYIDGANLQRSKVVHFGPTLGTDERVHKGSESGGRRTSNKTNIQTR